jgi:hypothetical protein
VKLCEREEIGRRFPWMNVDDLVLGTLGVGCGDGARIALLLLSLPVTWIYLDPGRAMLVPSSGVR